MKSGSMLLPSAFRASWLALAAFPVFVACNNATFRGKGAAAGDDKAVPQKILSCTLTPDKIKIGERSVVGVQLNGEFTGVIEQRIVSQSKTQKDLLNGTPAAPGSAFSKADGAPNEIVAGEVGDITVELRFSPDSAAPDAKCDLAVAGAAAVAPPEKPCQDGQTAVGAAIAFLIDNSNSNAATDCPAAQKTGVFRDADVYECGAPTAREKAVLSAFDVLATVGASGEGESMSRISVAEFPTRADFVAGYEIHSGWANTAAGGRDILANSLAFTRKPFGITPYGSAMTAADRLFSGLGAADGKARVAVLVTDGEPTDRDPQAVATAAQALRAKGVEIITVFITNGEKRSSREAEHIQMLNGFESSVVQAGQGHWFAPAYGNFDGYINDLLGRSGSPSLIQRVASPADAACQGDTCNRRQTVEVSDAQGLQEAFQSIIRTKAIQCR